MTPAHLKALGLPSEKEMSVQDILNWNFGRLADKKESTLLNALREFKKEILESLKDKGDTKKVDNSRKAVMEFLPELHGLDHEECWALYLNSGNEPVGKERISNGTNNACFIDNKKIIKKAVLHDADGIILCHNHPSGDTTPSTADVKNTEQLMNAAKLLDIRIPDHIIIAGNKYFSFADSREFTIPTRQ